ncbi:hypothetical protein DSM104443_02222 [Usitatibacter rugosus]|uniref:PsiF repeat-containing protein n=1 Tax=Usitatibacter rugosus TaxID=2732067 RepID=A0A6M4GV17_9PROT|nr:PsiF family protein [Usitatibacter rugosus]QJR11150.1 hypothetical protein DSM104443_02222 [Usitatibacter rugosus]
MRPEPITLALACAAALAFASPVIAADKNAPSNDSTCIATASSLEGEEKDKALAACPKPHSQQEKMKYCNASARVKDLHGDERRSFMSTCLKG